MIARTFRRVKAAGRECLYWMECHPRTGWYIAACVTINVILNIISLFH